MMLHVPKILAKEQVAEARRLLDSADWADGKGTVGEQGALHPHVDEHAGPGEDREREPRHAGDEPEAEGPLPRPAHEALSDRPGAAASST